MCRLKAREVIDQISLQPTDQQNHRGMLSISHLSLFGFSKTIAGPRAWPCDIALSLFSTTTFMQAATFVAALIDPVHI